MLVEADLYLSKASKPPTDILMDEMEGDRANKLLPLK